MTINRGQFVNSPDAALIYQTLAQLLGTQEGVQLSVTVQPKSSEQPKLLDEETAVQSD